MSSQTEELRSHCWSCHGVVDRAHIVCAQCHAVQPPDPRQTHFDRFGLKQKFALEGKALTLAFRETQRLTHPDRFVSATDRERRFALEQSTIINDAYRILREPMSRAGYLLKLLGIDVDDERGVKLSPEFLITILELRESLEELVGPDAHIERQKIQQSVALEYEEGLARLGMRLDATTKPDESALNGLGQLHAQLKYLRRTLDEIERLEAQRNQSSEGQLTRLDPLRPESLDRKGS